MLLDLFAVHLFFVIVYRVAYRDYTSCSTDSKEKLLDQEDPEEELPDPKDSEYLAELGDGSSGATTHPPRRSY